MSKNYTPIPTKEKNTENTPGTASENPSHAKPIMSEYPDPVMIDSDSTANNTETLKDGTVIGDLSTAKDLITLVNKNRIPTQINAVDGDSLLLPPGEHLVPGHFNWNLPAGIKIKED